MSDRNWRSNVPRNLTSPVGPRGEPCLTPVDRRWLWHLENAMSVRATTDAQREILRDLRQYLHETCEHHWLDYSTCCDPPKRDDTCIPPHRQCLWCNEVDWLTVSSGGSDA